ncbi:MAG: hypothetical protein HXX13_06135 [Bacteroidetes bacterium]|nr:hypothetical protein [Bacteroidota bacterium]
MHLIQKTANSRIKFFLLAFFLTSFVFAYPQHRKVQKATRERSPVVFCQKIIKAFAGQRFAIVNNGNKSNLNRLVLTDSTISRVSDFQNINATIQELNTHKQIIIDFNFMDNDRKQPMTVLLVHNPTHSVLFYKAEIYSVEKHKFIKVKVLPVMPGLTGVETWNFYSPSVILYKFRVKKIEFD